MNPYLTIQKKDYVPKTRRFPAMPEATTQEFRDPIAEGFRHYLDHSNANPPDPMQYADDYVEVIKQARPKVGQLYFDAPIRRQLLLENEEQAKKTTYEADYVYTDQRYEDPFARIDSSLTRGWVVPETTQRSAYRDPMLFDEKAHRPTKPFRGANNLGPNEKINEILQTKTGKSEYMAVVGSLGGALIEQKIHGTVVHQ